MSFHPEWGRWCYHHSFSFNAGFGPSARLCCVVVWYQCKWNVAELLLFGLPQRIIIEFLVLSSSSGPFGLQVLHTWSFLKLPWQRLPGCCDSLTVAVSPQSEQKQRRCFSIFVITPPGGTADWTHFNIFHCFLHTSAIKTKKLIFCVISQINMILYRNWN